MLKIKKEIIEAVKYKKDNPQTSITQIALIFSIDRHTLSKYENFDLDNLIFSEHFDCYIFFDENEKLAIDEYLNTNISYAKIRQKYGYKQERMIEKLLAIGVDIERKYKVNFNRSAFNKIETEEDAYILGFILADGYINEERNCLSIKLKQTDEDILIKINNYLGYEGNIKYGYHTITKNKFCYICYNSKELIQNLKKYGIFQGKSTKEIPYKDIQNNLSKHYIRGIIDGDGYIMKNKIRIGLCGSKEVLEFVFYYLKNNVELNLRKSKYITYDKTSNLYRLSFEGDNALKIIDYLYTDSKIYLNRKYNLAMRKLNGHE